MKGTTGAIIVIILPASSPPPSISPIAPPNLIRKAAENTENISVHAFIFSVRTFILALLFSALAGDTVAVSVADSPVSSDREDLFKETPVTETTPSVTVTLQVAALPSSTETVIIAVPSHQ